MAKLTKRVVDAAKAGSAAVFIWDDEVKGFGLRVSTGGSKSYVLNYRAGRDAPQHRITIGKHGSPWTPEQARREALRLLGAIASGDDAAAAREVEARTMTLAALCDLYLAEGVAHKKPSSLRSDRGRIKNHIVPLLGRLRIDHIRRADIERMARDVTAGRTAAPGNATAASWQARPGRTRRGSAGAVCAERRDELRGRARPARRQSGARGEETAGASLGAVSVGSRDCAPG
jgi:hypothetical protein